MNLIILKEKVGDVAQTKVENENAEERSNSKERIEMKPESNLKKSPANRKKQPRSRKLLQAAKTSKKSKKRISGKKLLTSRKKSRSKLTTRSAIKRKEKIEEKVEEKTEEKTDKKSSKNNKKLVDSKEIPSSKAQTPNVKETNESFTKIRPCNAVEGAGYISDGNSTISSKTDVIKMNSCKQQQNASETMLRKQMELWLKLERSRNAAKMNALVDRVRKFWNSTDGETVLDDELKEKFSINFLFDSNIWKRKCETAVQPDLFIPKRPRLDPETPEESPEIDDRIIEIKNQKDKISMKIKFSVLRSQSESNDDNDDASSNFLSSNSASKLYSDSELLVPKIMLRPLDDFNDLLDSSESPKGHSKTRRRHYRTNQYPCDGKSKKLRESFRKSDARTMKKNKVDRSQSYRCTSAASSSSPKSLFRRSSESSSPPKSFFRRCNKCRAWLRVLDDNETSPSAAASSMCQQCATLNNNHNDNGLLSDTRANDDSANRLAAAVVGSCDRNSRRTTRGNHGRSAGAKFLDEAQNFTDENIQECKLKFRKFENSAVLER